MSLSRGKLLAELGRRKCGKTTNTGVNTGNVSPDKNLKLSSSDESSDLDSDHDPEFELSSKEESSSSSDLEQGA